MKKLIICLCILATVKTIRSQSVAINTDGTLADSKAILDIKSTTKGLLIPRMTTAQRNAMGTPPNGLLVFDVNYSNYFFSSAGAWTQIGMGSNAWQINNAIGSVYYNGPVGVSIGTSFPYSKFNVNGTSWFQGDNTPLPPEAGQGIAIGYGGVGYIYAFDYLNFQPKDLALQHGGGNVGIGITTPVGKLHILNEGAGANLILEHPAIGDYSRLTFANGGSSIRWDIAGKIGFSLSDDKLNFSHSGFGNVMSMTGEGKVGIGTSAPAVRLHINGTGELLRLSGPTPILSFYDAGSVYKGYVWYNGADNMEMGTGGGNSNGNLFLSIRGTPCVTIQNDLRVRVGTNASIHSVSDGLPKFTVFGSFCIKDRRFVGADEWTFEANSGLPQFILSKNGGERAYVDDAGDWNSTSDVRLKENISAYKPVLTDIRKLQIATYHYKSNSTGKRSFGLIAQNVAAYFPEIVSTSIDKNGNDLMGIAYGKTGVLALKAIQEQQVIIESQEKRIEVQQKNMADQQKKIDELEKKVTRIEAKLSALLSK